MLNGGCMNSLRSFEVRRTLSENGNFFCCGRNFSFARLVTIFTDAGISKALFSYLLDNGWIKKV